MTTQTFLDSVAQLGIAFGLALAHDAFAEDLSAEKGKARVIPSVTDVVFCFGCDVVFVCVPSDAVFLDDMSAASVNAEGGHTYNALV